MDATAWAHDQFFTAGLPDIRLNRRLVEVAATLRLNPHGTLPQAFGEGGALKGAYRLFAHEAVTYEKLLSPHVTRTREACREPGAYLLIEDTTALSFTHRAPVPGLGPLTDESSQGLEVHTCLAVRVEAARETPEELPVTLVGVFGQECWARKVPQGTRAERKKAKRAPKAAPKAPCESDRWGRAVRETPEPPEGVRWTLVGDRESDIFTLFEDCARRGVDWVLRAAQPRKTLPSLDTVFDTVAQSPARGRYALELRARPGVKARTASLEVRAVAAPLCPPHGLTGRHAPLSMGAVEVREADPPEDVNEPIHWLLLTSWPCETFEDAQRAAKAYACRWLIEEYHKALKTGTHIEDTQLTSASGIKALLAVHAVVAADLLRLKLLARSRPDEPVTETLIDPDSLAVLEAMQGRPSAGWTNATLLSAIARLGGYLGRKHDGPPGWLTLWRGWIKLTTMKEGYILALQQMKSG